MSFIFFVYYIFYNLDKIILKKKKVSNYLIYEFATLTNRLFQIHLINTSQIKKKENKKPVNIVIGTN
jgi:hypothetical protein